MKRNLCLLVVLVSGWMTVSAALQFTANSIPQELKQGASSVVRADLVEYTLNANGTAVEVGMRAITVLEPEGRKTAMFKCVTSKEQELKRFSAVTYDRYGRKVRTESKKDLKGIAYLPKYKKQNFEWVELLPTPASYPFTVVYHWERKIENGTTNFPLLMPQKHFGQAVEYAEYVIAVPNGFDTKRLPIRHEENYTFQTTKKMDQHVFKMENVNALEDDPFSQKLFELAPMMVINPKQMNYKGVEREVLSWNDFADFAYAVLDTMGILADEQKTQMKLLTDSAETVEEKFTLLYDSLQVNKSYAKWNGLRGCFPIMPLDDWKFTDTADSRMMALYWWSVLKEAGVPADYVATNSWGENLLDFVPNLHQFDAALLRVRLPKDTLWMDFASPELPKGYFNSLWRGKKWLAVGNDGTHQLVEIPASLDTLNKQTSHNVVYVEMSGKATMQFRRTSYAMQYENEKRIMSLSAKKREKAIAASLAIPAFVRNVVMKEKKDDVAPSITTTASMINGQFATRIGGTLYMYPNVLHLGFQLKKNYREEGDDIAIYNGYCNTDTVDVYPPKGYYIDRVPQEKKYENSFGQFSFSFQPLPNQGVRLIYHLHLKKGIYAYDKYREFMKFCRNVTDSYSDRIFMKIDE